MVRPHVHFEVYPEQADITDATKTISTSQLALPRDVCDEVYAVTGYSASVPNLAQVSLADDTCSVTTAARSRPPP